MSKVAVTFVAKDYDYLSPLALGDVTTDGIEVKFVRATVDALSRTMRDTTVDAGEMSFSRHLIRLSKGDRSFIAIPFFTMRVFRHRSFFVRRGGGLRSLKDLVGKRVGVDDWFATGNTWSRAALREAGIHVDKIAWWVGSTNGTSSPTQDALPPYVQFVSGGRSLRSLLLDGHLDAIMCSYGGGTGDPDSGPPEGFSDVDGPIVRLFPTYHQVEAEYYRRTGVYPAHHVVGMRQQVFDRNPVLALSLYQALEQSKALWYTKLGQITENMPWSLEAAEGARLVMGPDWNPVGTAPNRQMVQTLCDELLAQGHITRPIDGASVFEEFERVAGH
jgi:4,5-dihydroxyphthalate decarboxylase